MEVNRIFEVVKVAEPPGCVLDPLDFGIDAFAGGIGNAVLQIGKALENNKLPDLPLIL